MNRNQFNNYLNSIFYNSIYDYKVKEDTNKMSEIDFCVQLKQKAKKDLDKYVSTIRTIFSLLIREQSNEVFKLYMRNLYNKCKSEIVRHYGLKRDIIDKIFGIICDEDNITQMEVYLKNNIYPYLHFIVEGIKSNEDRSLNAEQEENFLKKFDDFSQTIENPISEQDFRILAWKILKTMMEEKTILNLPYNYKEDMIYTIIQNISLEKGIQPLDELLFLPK